MFSLQPLAFPKGGTTSFQGRAEGQSPMSHDSPLTDSASMISIGVQKGLEPKPAARPIVRCSYKTVGLFAGIGGIERGLRAHHHASQLWENNEEAQAVLRKRFRLPADAVQPDVKELLRKPLPAGTELVSAGFPCQDLSQAGRTRGIEGARSGLVDVALAIVRKNKPRWLLLENVPFMLQLDQGRAMEHIVTELESMRYNWAYRIVDAMCFGLPQRRRRVFLLASRRSNKNDDPTRVLLTDDRGPPRPVEEHDARAFGFYWTEGNRGVGWAVNAIPTLKGGSGVGVASPPAVWIPARGRIVVPSLEAAEELQGFPAGYTDLGKQRLLKPGARWRMIGNAVNVRASRWIGKRLAAPRNAFEPTNETPLPSGAPWPSAAWNMGAGRRKAPVSEWPVRVKLRDLVDLLDEHGCSPLSPKAAAGFRERLNRSGLHQRNNEAFMQALLEHAEGRFANTDPLREG